MAPSTTPRDYGQRVSPLWTSICSCGKWARWLPLCLLHKELGLVSIVQGCKVSSGSGSPVGRASGSHIGQDKWATLVAVFMGTSWIEFNKRQEIIYPLLLWCPEARTQPLRRFPSLNLLEDLVLAIHRPSYELPAINPLPPHRELGQKVGENDRSPLLSNGLLPFLDRILFPLCRGC